MSIVTGPRQTEVQDAFSGLMTRWTCDVLVQGNVPSPEYLGLTYESLLTGTEAMTHGYDEKDPSCGPTTKDFLPWCHGRRTIRSTVAPATIKINTLKRGDRDWNVAGSMSYAVSQTIR